MDTSPQFDEISENVVMRVLDLHKRFPVSQGLFSKKAWLHAVNGVRLRVHKGETLGLVGESGCGKSTVGNMLLRLLTPDSGIIHYKGRDLQAMLRSKNKDDKRELARIQAVFQDPQSSLDPRMTVARIVGSPLLPYSGLESKQREKAVERILDEVGLGAEHMNRYPHEFSGGQRQRIGIARALIVQPEFIVFDEPTSALDVSVQAQILNLIKDLQKQYGYAYLFISHDLAVVRHVSHRVAVMYLGRVVETAPVEELFEAPRHPYTRALMESVPEPNPNRKKALAVLEGDVPSPVNLPIGCPFHPRCPERMGVCALERPERIQIQERHFVECWKYA